MTGEPMTQEEIDAEQEKIRQQQTRQQQVESNWEARAEYLIEMGELPAEGNTDEDWTRKATPFDVLDSENRTSDEVRAERMAICRACPRFFKLLHVCRECNCWMDVKVMIKQAECPIGKWGQA